MMVYLEAISGTETSIDQQHDIKWNQLQCQKAHLLWHIN